MNNSSLALKELCKGDVSKLVSVVLVVLNCLSAGAALLGNTIVLTAISQVKFKRNVSNYLIASLSAADLLVGLVMNPLLVAKISLNIWQGDHWLSVSADFMWLQTTTATTFSLCAVSYDRYIAIRSVFLYHHILTRKRAITLAIFIWSFSFLVASVRLCLKNYPQHLSKLWIGATLLTVFMPLLFIAFCYIHIYREAKIQMKKIARNEFNKKQVNAVRRNKKAACTVAIVIGLFVLLWIPTLAASIAEFVVSDSCESKIKIDYAWFWVAFLSFVSSAINPWIYTIRIREFRTFLKRQYVTRYEKSFRRSSERRAGSIPSDIWTWILANYCREFKKATIQDLTALLKCG